MNNTTLGNTSLLPFSGYILNLNGIVIAWLFSLVLRLPVNIYILQLIISRHWITSEFCTLKEAIFEIFVCFYNILAIAAYIFPNTYVQKTGMFIEEFIIMGHPSLLTLTCVERYLAVVKPVVFVRFKPLKYKLALTGIIWLWTLIFCIASLFVSLVFHYTAVVQITVCSVVQLYCCSATLQVLKRPGPGEAVRQTEGMSKIKLRAFRIILFITVPYILLYIPLTVAYALKDYMTMPLFMITVNVCYSCSTFTGYVKALLFLQRSGSLTFMKWP